MNENLQTILLGGGCFWCLEAVYQQVKGVERVVSGYAGGQNPNPTYQQVCTGSTGHAEVVLLTFNTSIISLHDILEIFFHLHDPTTLNRQGHDVGSQYRSVIFYKDEEQKKIALEVKEEIRKSGLWKQEIVTEISPSPVFYPAEDYHQNYFLNNPHQSYCQYVVSPKVAKFLDEFPEKKK